MQPGMVYTDKEEDKLANMLRKSFRDPKLNHKRVCIGYLGFWHRVLHGHGGADVASMVISIRRIEE